MSPRRARLLAALAAASCAAPPPPCPPVSSARVEATVVATEPKVAATEVESTRFDAYRDTARKIIEAARGKRDAFEKLRKLTDGVGHRLSGSPQLDRALQWGKMGLEADGHENVRLEKVMVPHWERGAESAELLAPRKQPLSILGLGGTVGTPKNGVEGEVVVVRSFEELEALGAGAKDKIVLFDVVMRPHDPVKGSAYGEIVGFRASGPARAAKLGAKAALVRSLATASLETPHTGATRYADDAPKIPAAAITTEGAALLARLVESGEKVRVRVSLGAKQHPDAPSANVVGELVGRDKPDEIVLLGAHIDSWDVGQGAHDDGAGCVIVMQALTTLRRLGLRPKRTIRVVLFTNEENGLAGATAYATDHASEVASHVLGLEADSGGFAPFGLNVEVPKDREEQALASVRDLVSLVEPIRKLEVKAHFSGADLIPLVKQGMTGIGLVTDGTRYFDLHHSAADTLDKVDPDELADDVAVVAVVAYVAAEMDGRI